MYALVYSKIPVASRIDHQDSDAGLFGLLEPTRGGQKISRSYNWTCIGIDVYSIKSIECCMGKKDAVSSPKRLYKADGHAEFH